MQVAPDVGEGARRPLASHGSAGGTLGLLVRDPVGTERPIVELRRRLDEFYRTTTAYNAFNATPDNSPYYREMAPLIDQASAAGTTVVRALELGAGRSTLADHLGDRRGRVHVTAQDVTPANEPYLRERCDDVYVGDIAGLSGPFDLVLSLFVFEHVSNPAPWLGHVDRLLAPGGWHVIVCPRYDVPGYVCPSLRHLSLARKAAVATFLAGSRLAVIAGRRPAFWVNADPAVFHADWYRDADAVHLVSRWDADRWHRSRGYTPRRLHLPSGGLRDWVLKRLLTVATAYQKPLAAAGR